MRILIACEFSGIVRDAFRARGFDAVSCDLLPTERPGPHIQDDVLNHLDGWDLIIAHPECTYLCNSGVRWLHERAGRWDQMRDGAAFFRRMLGAPCPRIAVENPVPHRYAVKEIGQTYTQTIQPWQFGDGEVKRTCLWLKGLPKLTPTNIVAGRRPRVHHEGPGPDRKKNRSRTYPGIANAMAAQWAPLLGVREVA